MEKKKFIVNYINVGCNYRWTVVEAEDEDAAVLTAFDNDSWGEIWKIINVEE